MKTKTLFFLFGLMFLVPPSLRAYDFQFGDLYYNIISNTSAVSVTCQQNSLYNYSGLTTAVIPETVTYDGTIYAVTSIGDFAFSHCSGLTSITIPESVTSIGDAAFSYCSGLTSITIPESVTSIGNYAFASCSGLTSITIPESVTSIGYGAFYYVFNIAYYGTATGSPWSARSVNGYVEGYLVYESAAKTRLLGCGSAVTGEIVIPESVTSIGGHAFLYCSGLTSVTIPESVTSIEGCAFEYCSGLTSVTIPASVTSIGNWAFDGCTGLTKTNYTGDIAGWCNIDFRDNRANPILYSRNLYINDVEVKGRLVIPNGVTSIGDYAFSGCSGLTSITIPESVTSIGYYAFSGFSGLTSVTIPESVTSIGYKAFSGCSGLISITIPESVTSIEPDAFAGTPWYDNQPDGVVYINKVLYAYKGTMSANTSIVVKDDIIYITDGAFSGCEGLTSITIPESVTRIGCSTLSGCTSLTSITCKAITPPRGCGSTFDKVSTDIPVYIPCGTIDKYRTALIWRDFTNLQELPMPDYIVSFENDGGLGYAQVESRTQNLDCNVTVVFSATPNFGYHFVQWGDGNTDNPRTITLTQDTTFTAIFAKDYSGKCGDNLYWQYQDNELRITGSGAMYNYTETTQPWLLLADSIHTIYIDNTASSIGEYAFANLGKLTKLHLGAGLENVGANAFAGCLRLGNIYSYAALPPLAEESSFANYNARLYVPCEVLGDYQLAIVFGNFKYIDCISSSGVDVPNNTVTVTPSTNDATFTWPSNGNANAYTLEITKDGVVFCTLTFNANGQLMGIAFAPSKDRNNTRAPQVAQATVNGWQFTVTGLNEGNNYAYTLTVTDNRGTELQTYNGTFRTLETTALDNVNAADAVPVRKIFRNGQVLILRGNEVYTVLGEKVE